MIVFGGVNIIRNQMRKITYILIVVALVMAACQMLTTNLLASDGSSFGELTVKYREQQERVGELMYQVMEARSVTAVQERADELGFVDQ